MMFLVQILEENGRNGRMSTNVKNGRQEPYNLLLLGLPQVNGRMSLSPEKLWMLLIWQKGK